MGPRTCPTAQQLQAFQWGDLPEPALDEVAEHLERCDQCETLARHLDTALDPILAAIRAPSTDTADGSTRIEKPVPLMVVSRLPEPVALPAPFPFPLPPMQPDEIGRLGNYRVLAPLGKGGMAYVFRAEDLALRRPVALKVMKPDLAGDAEGCQRFLREARIMAAIKHEHLVTVFQAGQEGTAVYLAMELLHGESLAERLRHAVPLAVAEIVRLGREIAGGLAVIHAHGLVHRDIKPGNIWLEAPHGRVKILDFGLARFVHDDAQLTQPGTVVGTPSFMAPEQARGEAVDPRSDLFSLGCVLYTLCTGHAPFQAANTLATLTALAIDTPRLVCEVNPTLPLPLADLVMQLLAKHPDGRPSSAEEVLQRLARIEARCADPAAPGGTISRWTRITRLKRLWGRRAATAGLVAIAVALLVAALQKIISPAVPILRTKAAVAGATYLSQMDEIEPENWPFPGPIPGPARDEPADWPAPKGCHRVYVKDVCSLHGLWMHLPPGGGGGTVSVSYRLDKRYSRFDVDVSLNDGPPDCIPLTFAVYGDGKLLWQSKPVSSQADGQPASVSVRDVAKLKLAVSGAGDERGTHAVWIEPRVRK